MKILIVTHHVLSVNSGGSFASRAYINAFSRISSKCRLLYPDDDVTISNYLDSKIELIPVKNRGSNISKLLDIYLGRLNRYYSVFWENVEEFSPDLIVFDNSRTSSGFICGVKKRNIKVVTIHHNFELEYYKGTPPNILWRHIFLYYLRKVEKASILLSDLNLTLTKQDLRLFKDYYQINSQANISTLGVFEFLPSNGIFESYVKTSKSYLTFAITGSLGAEQTEKSLIPFLDNFYPILKNRFPNSRLLLAGRNPSKLLLELCAKDSSISVVANPENMLDLLKDADVYLCPIFKGGGLKLRILDGLKAGLPVVTHKISARGYDVFKDHKMLFEYDDISSFKNSLDDLSNCSFSVEDIKKLFHKEFSFDSGVDRLKCLLESSHLL